jgi:GTP-binding protein
VTAPLRLTFVQSASTFSQLPDAGPEVAVVGRSNVGKSSLINALAGKKALAKVSNTPGRTQLINMFSLDDGAGALIDLPGFGYAKVSKTMRAGWSKMIDAYLLNSENLAASRRTSAPGDCDKARQGPFDGSRKAQEGTGERPHA